MPKVHGQNVRGPGGVIEQAPQRSKDRRKGAEKKTDLASQEAALKPPSEGMPVAPRASDDKARPKPKAVPKVVQPPDPQLAGVDAQRALPDIGPKAKPDAGPQAQPDLGPQAQPDVAEDEAPMVMLPGGDVDPALKPGTPEYIAAGKAEAEKAKKEREEEAAAEKRARLKKWYVPGQDDESTVDNLVNSRGARPDNVDESHRLAAEKLRTITQRNERDRYKKLSDDDIKAVALYTTQAAYPVNAILRGKIKSEPWMKAYGAMARQISKALAKMPKEAQNTRFRTTVDPTKAGDKTVTLNKVYRNDVWTPMFEGVFASEFAVGRSLEEPAFFSATVVQGSYLADAPVRRTIEGAKFVRSIEDLALLGAEREALFPPGQRFQITSIELEDTKTGKRESVSKPQARFPANNKGEAAFNRDDRVWHVKMKHVGVATGKSKDAKPDKKKKAGKDADGPKKPGFLEHLLGIANVMD